MKKVNRGKDFEKQIQKCFENVPNISIDRLHDQMNGYAGSSNICDFIVYYYPIQLYIECKATYGNTLPFSRITETQYNGLLEKEKIKGVASGYIIWYIDCDKTYFVPAYIAKEFKDRGCKSINQKDLVNNYNAIKLEGIKKRVFYNYDMTVFLNDVKNLKKAYNKGGVIK